MRCAKPSQAKVLTEGGDLREAQVDIPLSYPFLRLSALLDSGRHFYSLTGGYANANGIESAEGLD